MKAKRGKSQKLWKCCREIRIQGANMIINGIYTGYNTLTEEEEKWLCLKISKDYNDNILQRIYTNPHN